MAASTKSRRSGGSAASLLKKGQLSPFPSVIKPMLATLVDKPFDEPGWQYEVKWDGYRAIGLVNDGSVELRSRNNKSFNDKFYPVYEALEEWRVKAVVDGEIIVLNENGAASFDQLQAWRSEADGPLVYYLFDLLWLDGYDITRLPLSDRRKLLQSIIPHSETLRMSESFDAGAKEFF